MIRKTLIGTVKHVWSEDPALDKSDPDKLEQALKRFAEAGDEAALPLKEGERPAVFTLGPLTRKQYLRAVNLEGAQKLSEAVAFGVRAVSGFEVNGQPVDLERTETQVGKRLTEAALDAIFDANLFGELAVRIFDISRIDPIRGQG